MKQKELKKFEFEARSRSGLITLLGIVVDQDSTAWNKTQDLLTTVTPEVESF